MDASTPLFVVVAVLVLYVAYRGVESSNPKRRFALIFSFAPGNSEHLTKEQAATIRSVLDGFEAALKREEEEATRTWSEVVSITFRPFLRGYARSLREIADRLEQCECNIRQLEDRRSEANRLLEKFRYRWSDIDWVLSHHSAHIRRV